MRYEYSERLEKIEAILDPWLPPEPDAAWMRSVFPGLAVRGGAFRPLAAPLRDLLERGGKRWRPLLSLLVCEAFGGAEAVLPLLPLVEFPHNASLIHDDIEDRSARRRGKAALHLVYGEDTAINAGAFLYFLPLACLEAWDGEAEAKNAIWALWARHMRALHLGQSMDIAWHRGEGLPSPSDYETMCSLKTGCLARFAALLGAEAALGPGTRESGSEAAIAGRAAEQWGVGFQILDDVKNLTTGLPGKQRGDDIVEGKMSLPVLYFVWGPDPAAESEADPERLALVRRCCAAARSGGTGVPEVEELISALAAAGSIGAAANRGRALIGEASAALAALPVRDRAAGRLLAELPAVLQERME